MSRKKTQRGVEMRSTYGMKTRKQAKTWVVVADRSQGKVFEWNPKKLSLIQIKSWDFPKGKMKGREIVSDRPGRVFNSSTFARGGHQTATPRHSYSSENDPAHQEALVFAKKIADWLEKGRERKKDIEFIMVTEPQFMGYITQKLSQTSQRKIKKKWRRDFHWVDETDIKDRIVQWLSGRRRPIQRLLPRRIGAYGFNTKAETAYGR